MLVAKLDAAQSDGTGTARVVRDLREIEEVGPECLLRDVVGGLKDGIKESLFDTLGWKDRGWSPPLGRASSELLWYFAETQLAAAHSLLIESNFDPATQDITFLRPMQILERPADGPCWALIGTAEQVAEDLRVYEQVGINHLALGLPTSNGQEILQQVKRFAAEGRPQLQ